MLFSGLAWAQWSKYPTENLKLNDRSLYDFEMAVLQDGSFYIVYNGPANGHIPTSVLYYDKGGHPIWDKELLVADEPNMTWTQVNQLKAVDRKGNLFLSVADCRHHTGPTTYTAYKVTPKGELPWGKDGISLNKDFNGLNHSMSIVALADGSAVYGWYEKPDNAPGIIRMQRISADGQKCWGEAGKVLSFEKEAIETPVLVDAGNNEFLVLYAKGSSRSLYCDKFNFDGTSVWGEDVLVADGSAFPSYPIHTLISTLPVDGGMLVAWVDVRHGDYNKTVCAAYIDKGGKHGFLPQETGVELGQAASSTGQLVYDPEANTFLVAWLSEGKIMGQLLSTQGEFLWDPDGKELVRAEGEVQVGYLRAQRAESGKYGLFHMTNAYGKVEIAASLIDDQGTLLWEIPTRLVSSVKSEKKDLAVGEYRNNQWIMVWNDARAKTGNSTEGHLLYAQNINRDCLLGEQPADDGPDTTANESAARMGMVLEVVPNPVSGRATVGFVLEETGPVVLCVKDRSGKAVVTVYEGGLPAGPHQIEWSASALPAGLYLMEVRSEKGLGVAKVIVRP